MKISKLLILFLNRALVLLLLLVTVNNAMADTENSTNFNNPTVGASLNYRVNIPSIIYFRVGSATKDLVDKVTIDLNQSLQFSSGTSTFNGGANPLGNGTEIAATDNGDLVVDVRGNVGDIVITYEIIGNVNGLDNGAGRFIPYSQIKTTSSDNTNLPAPVLENGASAGGSTGTSVTIAGHEHGNRVVDRQAVWTYSYLNQIIPVAGTYEGRVEYTASAAP